MVHYGLLPDADIAKRSIEHAGISFSTAATKKKDMLHFLEILYQSNPKSIGGALPGEDFFYQP